MFNLTSVKEHKQKMLFFGYLFSLFFLISDFTPFFIRGVRKLKYSFYGIGGPLYVPFLLMFALLVLYSMFPLLSRQIKKSHGIKQIQMKYVFWASVIGYGGGVIDFLPMFGINVYNIGNLVNIFFASIVTYAILTYNLMDINVKNAALVIGAFILSLFTSLSFFYFFYNIIHLNILISNIAASIVCFSVFLFLFWRLNETVFKKEEAYHKTLTDTSIDMVRNFDPRLLAKGIVDTTYDVIGVNHSRVYLFNRQTGNYELQAARGNIPKPYLTFKKDDPITIWYDKLKPSFAKSGIVKEKDVEILEYSLVNSWFEDKFLLDKNRNIAFILPKLKTQMEELNIDIIVPSIYRRRLLGFLLLGEKEKGIYTQKDKDVLSNLARYATMAIRNAFQVQDRRRRSHERSILIQRLKQSYKELKRAYRLQRDTFFEIAEAFLLAIQIKDPYFTLGHIKRTRAYIPKLVRKLEENGVILKGTEKGLMRRRELILIATTLHDAGKIFVEEKILNKPGPLNPEEYEILKKHTIWGAEIFQKIEGLKAASDWIRHHHERYDGAGYPDGLKGEDIPIEARIIAVVDSYDAMIGDRPYRKTTMTKSEAIGELKCGSGTQFDPVITKAMCELYESGQL